MTFPSGTKKKKIKIARKMTPGRLENIALHHLDRYATSAENLRQVLSRRAWKSARDNDTDLDQYKTWIDDLIARYQVSGLLDDATYARAQSETLHRRGKSIRAIAAVLLKKGVPGYLVDEALASLANDTEDPDLMAALGYARRRRFGPYRTRDIDDKGRHKELAALAWAGFSYAIANRIINAETVEEIEQGG